jgi:predicted  nucleic acid-binding Zn-ribbon protein
LDEVKRSLDDLSHEIAAMKQGTAQMGSPSMGQDTQLLSARIENVKTVLEELIKRKVEVDMKIEKLDKTMTFMQTRSPEQMSQEMRRDFESLNRNFSVVNSRMDAIESVSKNLSDDMQKVRSLIQKFDTFEKASGLAKELQSRMEEFKFIENEVKRISSRVEGFYENLDQRLDKIREFERVFPQLKQEFDRMKDEMMKRMDESKISVLDRATKDETSSLRDRMSQMESKLSGTQFKDMEATMERMKQDLRQAVKEAHEPLNVINIEISDVLSRIVGMEMRLSNIERMFQSGRSRPVIIE